MDPRQDIAALLLASSKAQFASAETTLCIVSGGVTDGTTLARGAAQEQLLDALILMMPCVCTARPDRIEALKHKALKVFQMAAMLSPPETNCYPPLLPPSSAATSAGWKTRRHGTTRKLITTDSRLGSWATAVRLMSMMLAPPPSARRRRGRRMGKPVRTLPHSSLPSGVPIFNYTALIRLAPDGSRYMFNAREHKCRVKAGRPCGRLYAPDEWVGWSISLLPNCFSVARGSIRTVAAGKAIFDAITRPKNARKRIIGKQDGR